MADKNSQTNSEVDWFLQTNKKEAFPTASSPEADSYKRQNKRGTAIIFNHKHFNMKECSTRLGTDKDRDDIKKLLDDLKFDVFSHNDLTLKQVMEVLDTVSKMDHSDSDCLMVVVMSHGDNGIIYAKDRYYPTKKLWNFFTPIHCPSLAGKPKLFFIQACRGDHTDPGFEIRYDETDSGSQDKVYSIPVMADILVMYATAEGMFSLHKININDQKKKKGIGHKLPSHIDGNKLKDTLPFYTLLYAGNSRKCLQLLKCTCKYHICSSSIMAGILGYFAWRDPENGSYFIQALVNQLRKLHKTKDLLSILTCVNREVAIGFTSLETQYPELNGKKEMCSIVSMLTRLFYLN